MSGTAGLLIAIVIILLIIWIFEFAPYIKYNDKLIPVQWDKLPVEKRYFPTTGGAVINFDNKDCLFVAGGQGQSDVLLWYNPLVKQFEPLYEFEKPHDVLTYSVAVGDMSNAGREDLVVGRNDGVYIFEQIMSSSGSRFIEKLIWTPSDKEIPMSISLCDYDNSGFLSIYVANHIRWYDLKIMQFSDLQAQRNVLLKRQDTLNYVDIAPALGIQGTSNSWACAFVDLGYDSNIQHDGTVRWPDLVVANDEGTIDIYRNTEGHFTKVSFDSPIGAWMGIAVGDFTKNGRQSLFFTNMGTANTMANVASYVTGKDIPKKYTHKHMMLINNGNYEFEKVFDDTINNSTISWGANFIDYGEQPKLFVAQGFKMMMWQRFKLFRPAGGVYDQSDAWSRLQRFENRNYGSNVMMHSFTGSPNIIWFNMESKPTIYEVGTHDKQPQQSKHVLVKVPKTAKFANAIITLHFAGASRSQQVLFSGGLGPLKSDYYFSLGTAKPLSVTVDMVNGDQLVFDDVRVNSVIEM